MIELIMIILPVAGFCYAMFLGIRLNKLYRLMGAVEPKIKKIAAMVIEAKSVSDLISQQTKKIDSQMKDYKKKTDDLYQDYAYYLKKGEEWLSVIDPAVHSLYLLKQKKLVAKEAERSQQATVLSPKFFKQRS